jgi:hypothetical protein
VDELYLSHPHTHLKLVPDAEVFTQSRVNPIAMGKALNVGVVVLSMMLI